MGAAKTWFAYLLATGCAGVENDAVTAFLQPRDDHVRLWADFGSAHWSANRAARCVDKGPRTECGLSDKEAAFIAKTYDIVSLEKCFGQGTTFAKHKSTVDSSLLTARQIKKQPGGNATKILFYWSSHAAYTDCYEDPEGGDFMKHPEWWLMHKDGKTAFVSGVQSRPYIDFTAPGATEWWVDVVAKVYKEADGAIDGIFIDSAGDWADHLPPAEFTPQRIDDINKAHVGAIRKVSKLLHEKNPSSLVLANMLGTDAPETSYELMKDGTLDGVCAEHFGAFEWANRAGLPVQNIVDKWLQHLRRAAQLKKIILVKAWVGPETTPIDGRGPTWSRFFRDPKTRRPMVRSNDGIAKAAEDMLDYSLAAFLCVAEPGFMFSYTWWYDVSDGNVPGEDAPKDWYPQLQHPIGKPKGPPHFRMATNAMGMPIGKVCTRSYEGADISVNLLSYYGARIIWKTFV